MAYDEKLARRVRRLLAGRRALTERKMFGGIAFLIRGHMCCGVLNDELIVRLEPAATARALQRPHVRAFDFTGRAMKGFVVVRPAGSRAAASLRRWLDVAQTYVASLPAKESTVDNRASKRR